jgi:hypothetical protein
VKTPGGGGSERRPGSSGPSDPSRGGFALLVVVLLLFAVGVAAAAAYQVVNLEHQRSGFSSDSDRAHLIAEAGLNRLMGDRTTVAAVLTGAIDTVAYDIEGGDAFVTARRAFAFPGGTWWEERYRIHSTGRLVDPRFFDAPAIREGARFARMPAPPLHVLAPFVTTADSVEVVPGPPGPGFNLVRNDGAPASGPDSCFRSQSGSSPPYHVVAGVDVSAPAGMSYYTPGDVLVALGAPDWGVLATTFPVDCDTAPGPGAAGCGFGTDDFVVYRHFGDLAAGAGQSGSGVLIVTGRISFSGPGPFQWDGIVLAGGIESIVDPPPPAGIRGMLVAGFSPADTPSKVRLERGTFQFHSCNVADAGRALGILNPEPLTFWSAY